MATYAGATSVVLSLTGFLRWVFVVPPLARSYVTGAAATRAAADAGCAARRAAVEITDCIEAELVERLGRDPLDAWRSVTDALIEIHLHEAPDTVRVAAEMSSAGG